MILTLRSDTSFFEISLYDNGCQVGVLREECGREMATRSLASINSLLASVGITTKQLSGIIVYAGPGSFTSLRISHAVANTLAYAESLPICSKMGENWIHEGLEYLAAGHNDAIVVPYYGKDANITKPK